MSRLALVKQMVRDAAERFGNGTAELADIDVFRESQRAARELVDEPEKGADMIALAFLCGAYFERARVQMYARALRSGLTPGEGGGR